MANSNESLRPGILGLALGLLFFCLSYSPLTHVVAAVYTLLSLLSILLNRPSSRNQYTILDDIKRSILDPILGLIIYLLSIYAVWMIMSHLVSPETIKNVAESVYSFHQFYSDPSLGEYDRSEQESIFLTVIAALILFTINKLWPSLKSKYIIYKDPNKINHEDLIGSEKEVLQKKPENISRKDRFSIAIRYRRIAGRDSVSGYHAFLSWNSWYSLSDIIMTSLVFLILALFFLPLLASDLSIISIVTLVLSTISGFALLKIVFHPPLGI